jgi:thiol-disulfide isomerase/thioredoxin/Fe-S-cluster-containing hydrogenase component 2
MYKIPMPKMKKSPLTRALSYLKYVILVLFAVVLPLLYAFRDFPLPAFCKYICPAGTLGGAIGLLANGANQEMFGMLGPLFTWKFALAVGFTVSVIFLYRAFCRFFCPLGALYGLFNRIALFGVKLDRHKCVDCGICYSKCKMDIRSVGDRECISCGDCVAACPTGAIRQSGSRIFLAPNEIGEKPLRPAEAPPTSPEEARRVTRKYRVRRIIAAALAGLVLLGALLYYNVFDRPLTVSEGFEVGEKCPALSLDVYGGGAWKLESGTFTVINFWGTWCGPCVEELPDFDRIAAEFPAVSVVAVHSSFETENVPAYLEREYPASAITFCHDGEGEESYYTALGGKGTYPLTVIVGEDGIILARFVGAVSMPDPAAPDGELGPYETLKYYVTKA